MQAETVAEQLFFVTIRIDTVLKTGERGSGTGFFFELSVDEKKYPFIVTNKHVVIGMHEGALTFLKGKEGKPMLGEAFNLRFSQQEWQDLWYGHPDNDIDIAVCPLLPLLEYLRQQHAVEPFFRKIDSSLIPTPESIQDLDAIEHVTFVGYPNGVWDSKNYLPVARRGATATPIGVDFEGTPRFIVDASVFGGSSGSPVFILNQGSWAQRRGGLVAGTRLLFVGVIAAVFFRTDLNEVIPVPIPSQLQMKQMAKNQEMIDLGIVFKASTVVETIEAFLKWIGEIT